MKQYEVSYEFLTVQLVTVEATSKAAAIEAVRDGGGEGVDANVIEGSRRKFIATELKD